MNYLQSLSIKETPQNEPIFGADQVENNGGGYVYESDKWARLRRFLILGSESGTFYCGERELTLSNATNILDCIHEDGYKTLQAIYDVSCEGLGIRNDECIFALALLMSHGSLEDKKAAAILFANICRTASHLFLFASFIKQHRGWGRLLRRTVASWYENHLSDDKGIRDLSYQAIKYRKRYGYTHRDLLRLSHPNPLENKKGSDLLWLLSRKDLLGAIKLTDGVLSSGELSTLSFDELPDPLKGYSIVNDFDSSIYDICSAIEKYDLPREAIATEYLNNSNVWKSLLKKMPLTALVRNLGVMTSKGALMPMSDEVQTVVDTLENPEIISKSRIHPIQLLLALSTYESGHGFRGSLSWEPIARVVDAINRAFYLSFKNIEKSTKRVLIGLDVSGSMGIDFIGGKPITPREASVAMCMVAMHTYSNSHVIAFSDEIVPFPISTSQRLSDAINKASNMPFGRTDCALPMLYALEKKLNVDTFIIYTDNETWYGDIHPKQALDRYREKINPDAKLITVAMTSTEFSIADPSVDYMFDVVGFDASLPKIISTITG